MYRILIIEDDFVIARSLAQQLGTWEFDVDYVTDFKNILGKYTSYNPQLVLLDISLPFYNGYHWCAEIRKLSKVPVMFISSAGDNMNIVMAMNMGGDDFIVKPFDLNVLVAKIQALLRRTYTFQGQLNVLEHRGVILNLNDPTVEYQDMKTELTKNEFRILQILMENTGKVVKRDDLMTRLWENDSYIDDNTLTVNINRLRKKLELTGLADFIVTRKGMGYLIE